ncbi:hypothetical protein H2248_007959 [Termitomyces sp. 'cryptogamus']|nr:hypothetical protein H2248_007959 [Termitomyces sp. 'cryptogamus']
MGKSFEIRPTGRAHVELVIPVDWVKCGYPEAPERFGLRRVVEHCSWKKVMTSVSGFIVGEPPESPIQLHLLALQTYKLIMARLSRLDKALSPVDVDLAASLLDALNVSFESVPEDSDIELANPSTSDPKSSLELPLTPAL